jgi:hypothetical protein
MNPAPIIGNVQERVVGRISLGGRSASACCAPPRRSPGLGAAPTAGRLPTGSRGATAAVAFQVLGHHRPKLPVSLGGDPEHTGRRRRRRVGGGDHRAWSQSHGLNLRSGGLACQCPHEHTGATSRAHRAHRSTGATGSSSIGTSSARARGLGGAGKWTGMPARSSSRISRPRLGDKAAPATGGCIVSAS